MLIIGQKTSFSSFPAATVLLIFKVSIVTTKVVATPKTKYLTPLKNDGSLSGFAFFKKIANAVISTISTIEK